MKCFWLTAMIVHLILKSHECGGPERCDALNRAHVDVRAVFHEVSQEVDVAVENRAQQRRPAEPTLGVDRRPRAAEVLYDFYVALIDHRYTSMFRLYKETRVSHLEGCHVERRPVINVLGYHLASILSQVANDAELELLIGEARSKSIFY